MANLIIDNISLIILLPLWIFLIIMCGRFFAVYVHKTVIYILTLISSFIGMLMTSAGLLTLKDSVEWSLPFIKIDYFVIDFGLRVDKLSLIMAFILFLISFSVQLFSVSYMRAEKKNYRFYALLNLFNFAMSAMFFSPNLFQMFFFWEISGITSYLLIGFDYKEQKKSEASRRVFIINRIGDTALIGAILLTSCFMYLYAQNNNFSTLAIDDLNILSTLLSAYTPAYLYFAVCGMYIFASAVKSAQLPFYTWLQDAMEAKLPVSALLHSATIVASGVYLLIRLMPFFTLQETLMHIITILGALTAIICSVLAFMENDYKKVLAYSTSANFGLIFFALGLGEIRVALILFTVHALTKSMLFMLLPQNKQISYAELFIFILGALSLAGVVFAGFSAKEIFFNAIHNDWGSYFIILTAILTSFYITKLTYMIWRNSQKTRVTNLLEILPAIILILINIVLFIKLPKTISLLFYIASAGILITILLNKYFKYIPQVPGFLEKFYENILPKVYYKLAYCAETAETKIFSNYKFLKKIALCTVKISGYIEKNIIEVGVGLLSGLIKEISKFDLMMQTKKIQSYNIYAFILVTIIITLVIIGYNYILPVGG